MQVTNGQIWAAVVPSEGELSPMQEILKERWPVKTSYWLTKLGRKLGEHLRDIHEVRNPLFAQYGDGRTVAQDSEIWPEFVKAHNELMAVEVVISMDKITLPLSDDVKLSPQTLMLLEPFVEITE